MGDRGTTVLFAGLAGSEKAAGEEGAIRIAEMLAHAGRLANGRLAGRSGRDVMALFASPDGAAQAALRIHAYWLTLPPLPGVRGMRFGMHCGPVGQHGDRVFGDTVDHALRLAEIAGAGEVLMSQDAADALGSHMRALIAAERGPVGRMRLGELVFRTDLFAPRPARLRLQLTYRAKSIVRRRQGDTVSIGSDSACDLTVEHSAASRRHCTISRGEDACLLRDHSDAGTFVTMEGGRELALRGGEVALSGSGTIAFGDPAQGGREVVRYSCEARG